MLLLYVGMYVCMYEKVSLGRAALAYSGVRSLKLKGEACKITPSEEGDRWEMRNAFSEGSKYVLGCVRLEFPYLLPKHPTFADCSKQRTTKHTPPCKDLGLSVCVGVILCK